MTEQVCPHCQALCPPDAFKCGSCQKLIQIRWTRHLITSVVVALMPAAFVFRYSWNYAQELNNQHVAAASIAYGFYVFMIFFAATACFFLGTDWLRINRRDD